MNQSSRYANVLNFIYSCIIGFSINYCLLVFFKVTFNIPFALIACIVSVLLCYATIKSKIAAISIGIIAVLAFIAPFILEKNFVHDSFLFFKNILNQTINTENQITTFWSIVICFVFTFLFTFLNTKVKLHAISFFISLSLFIGLFLTTDNYSTTIFYILLTTLILFLVIVVGNKLKNNNALYSDINGFKIAMYLSPFLIIIIAVVLLLAKPKGPIVIPWLDTKINDAFVKQALAVDNGNSFNTNAFGIKSNRLDGAVLPNGLKVLTVKTLTPFHIKSSVKEVYNKNKWETAEHNFTTEPQESVISKSEAENALKYFGVTSNFEYLYKQNANIKFLDIASTQLYQPLLIDEISVSSNMLKYSDNGEIIFKQKQVKGFEYSFTAYIPIYGNENFKFMLRQSYKGLYKNYAKTHETDELTEKLITRTDDIYSKYLQLSTSITDRTYALGETITKNATNNYDKAVAIEQYLSKNHTYNLYTKKLPAGEDFVDNFLFETKKGYCTYYATSMVILARINGIPARYVEGYTMPNFSNLYDEFKVTNLDAHAWPELYFEGFGWVPFEPTTPQSYNFYKNNISIEKNQVVNSDYIKLDPLTFISSIPLASSSEPEEETNIPPDDLSSSFPPDNNNQSNINHINYNILTVILVLILLSLALVLFFIYRKSCADKLFRKNTALENKNAVIALYEQYLNLISIATNQKRVEHLTLNEYIAVLGGFDEFYNNNDLKTITELYLAAVFSNHTVENEQLYKFVNYYPILKQHLEESTSKITLLYCKYIRGVI